MINALSLSQLQQALKSSLSPIKLIGDDVSFCSVSIDSRTLDSGDLYVALSGEHFDGHDYIDEAVAKGCCAVVVEKPVSGLSIPQLVVANTVHAYGLLGRLNRDYFNGSLVAITGSCGKTTVKELLVSVLSQVGSVHYTQKNFNNHIGVPKTLLDLNTEHQFSVLELGASAVGEISYLAGLVNAQVALVNNIQPAHVEGFGSVAAIATEKAEIYQSLSSEGFAVVNLDEPYSQQWLPLLATKKVITYSQVQREAMITASDVHINEFGKPSFTLHLPGGEYHVALNILGQHNVSNALAVASIAIALGVDEHIIVSGLCKFCGVTGRLAQYAGLAGSSVIDDTYNANPGSVRAAIDVLAAQNGERILVLGDMGELGEGALDDHKQVGLYAAEKGIEHLFTVGELSQASSAAFGPLADHSQDKAKLISSLIECLQLKHKNCSNTQVTVLIKGSRSSRMEDVVNAIKQKG